MYQRFRNDADFLTIYIREAHPEDEWQMEPNVKEDVCYRQPRTLAERVAIVNDFIHRFSYPVPMAVDDMDDRANKLFGAWPERLYIFDENGKIVYKGGNGPFNYRPEEVNAWLETVSCSQSGVSRRTNFLLYAPRRAQTAGNASSEPTSAPSKATSA